MNQEQAVKTCICGSCPSYFNCGEKLAFCLWESGKVSAENLKLAAYAGMPGLP